MATGKEIRYAIKADSSQLLSELGRANARVKQLEKESRNLKRTTNENTRANKRFGSSIRTAGIAIKGFIAAAVVQASLRLAQFAGKVASVEAAYRSLASGVEGGSEALLKAVSTAARGTISNLDIMESSNLALQLMGEGVAVHLPKMAEIALATARASGRDVSEAYNDIIVAAGRQSVQVLDNLGISSTTAGQKMDEFAASLGKTRNQLTAAEKRQAFFYAVMEAGQEIIDRTNMSTLTTGERLQIIKAKASNAAVTFTRELTPALNAFMDVLTDTNDEGQSVAQGFGKVVASIILLAAYAVEYLKNIGAPFKEFWGILMMDVSNAIWNMMDKLAVVTRAMGLDGLTRQLESARSSMYELNEEGRVMRDGAREQTTQLRELERLLAQTWSNPSGAGQAAIDRIGRLRQQLAAAAAAARAARVALKQLKGSEYHAIIGNEEQSALHAEIERYQQLVDTHELSAEQRTAIEENHLQRMDEIRLQHNQFAMSMLQGLGGAFQTSFSAIDAASKQLVYNMLWGKGGWKEFRKNTKEIMKQLLADILYAIARAAILQAILAGTGMGGGGLVAKTVIGAAFEKGYLPALEKGQLPVFASGYVPKNHFPALIGSDEYVADAATTRANYDLFSQLHNNKGSRIGGTESVTTHTNINLDGRTIAEVVDVHRNENARNSGAQNYGKRSVYK